MDDEEIAERTRKERADIVRKYDIGREEGAVIDPWEDPDFEVNLDLGGGRDLVYRLSAFDFGCTFVLVVADFCCC